jgi:hypothetical protein
VQWHHPGLKPVLVIVDPLAVLDLGGPQSGDHLFQADPPAGRDRVLAPDLVIGLADDLVRIPAQRQRG